MIKKRQKNYVIGGLVNTAMIGTSVLGLKQGADQAEQMEEQARMQRKSDAKTRELLEDIARQKNPEKNAMAAEVVAQQKGFSVMTAITKLGKTIGSTNAGGFAKDMYKIHGGTAKKTIGMMAGFAGLDYIGNRAATSLKNHDEGRDDKNMSFLKKAAITGATVGGGILAARKGLMGGKVQQFMTSGRGGKALSGLKTAINPIKRKEDGSISKYGTLGSIGGNAFFASMPVVSYLAQKKAKGDMTQDTAESEPTQTSYSVMAGLKAGFKTLKSHPGQTISGAANKVGSFLSFFGKGGTKAVQNTGEKMMEAGNSKWTQDLGKWITKRDINNNLVNATKANLLATGGAAVVGGTAMGIGTKAVKAPTKMWDRDAYKMSEQENQNV